MFRKGRIKQAAKSMKEAAAQLLVGNATTVEDRDVALASWSRKVRRSDAAVRQAALAAPRRRKFEKRGAPNRSSKGRKPLR